MSKRFLHIVLAAAVLAAGVATAIPASAQLDGLRDGVGNVVDRLICPVNGVLMTREQCDALQQQLEETLPSPGDPIVPGPPSQPAPPAPAPPAPPPDDGGGGDTGGGGGGSAPGTDGAPGSGPRGANPGGGVEGGPRGGQPGGGDQGNGPGGLDEPLRNPDGSPSRSNPTRVDVLPGPSTATSVPNFIINKFRVPIFLLPIYQAAGTQYGVRWEVLAAINEIETDYGRNLNVSTAGAMGWMQFLPPTWRIYGVDANKDGVKDPYNPVDAIFAAARYLAAAGYEKDVREAIFAYNHADWYVDSVLMRARLIAGIPSDLTGSLTGLTEGRFPVHARAKYADDISEAEAEQLVSRNQNAAQVETSDPTRKAIEIYTREGAPAVATQDGRIKRIGRDESGQYIVLEDVYGNRYTYSGLQSVARFYPVPKTQPAAAVKGLSFEPTAANADEPRQPASAGRQIDRAAPRDSDSGDSAGTPETATKQRLFANPARPRAMRAGGADQLGGTTEPVEVKGFTTYTKQFSAPFGLDREGTRPERLVEGARVIGGTILGQVGTPDPNKASHLVFEIQPGGRGAPKIDPKPILDGWKLLEETAIYRARGENVLRGQASIGQLLLLSKPLLERRVLADNRIEVYDCGRQDIQTGQIDRRVLVTLAYLAESGMRPTVTSLKCGRTGILTASGNVSNHVSGNAADIAQINGIPVLGNQDRGGIVEAAVKRILQLQGTMTPDEVISLFDFGGPSFALSDHHDHIHVGFTPLYANGEGSRALSREALQILRPGQWHDLIDQIGSIDNPDVIKGPESSTLPAGSGHRASEAHRGE